MAVDAATLVDAVRGLEARGDSAAAPLRAAAAAVDGDFLAPEGLAAYFEAIVDRARAAYGQGAVLDDPCAARDFFAKRLDCSEVGALAEFHLANDKACRYRLDAADPLPGGGPRPRAPQEADGLWRLSNRTLDDLRRARPLSVGAGCGRLVQRADDLCACRTDPTRCPGAAGPRDLVLDYRGAAGKVRVKATVPPQLARRPAATLASVVARAANAQSPDAPVVAAGLRMTRDGGAALAGDAPLASLRPGETIHFTEAA